MMQIDKQQTEEVTHLRIAGDMTIYEAAALHAALLESLAGPDAIELDLAGVTELDTAGFQQLYLLRREARAAGKSLRITLHSAATREVFDLYRAHPYFDDPS
jgi:anti-sigma B factor antagonist